MSPQIVQLKPRQFPSLLQEINDPPDSLYILGEYPDEKANKFLCVVGSRRYSDYGKAVVTKLISELRGQNVVIISGLALGIDSLAHKSALEAGLKTIAVPGSGLDESVLYPRTNINLARTILEKGGALISEFEPDFKATPWSFPQRNRIMAGLAHAILVIEAEEKSGTLITSRLATEYNRDVLVVPGPIFNSGSKGSHMLLRGGAIPVTSGNDILDALDIIQETGITERLFDDLSLDEQRVVKILETPMERDDLLLELDVPVHKVNVLLSSLEIKGVIEEKMGKIYLK